MTPKVWLWGGRRQHDDYVMLLIEDVEGNLYGITFSGAPADPHSVAMEASDAFTSSSTPWRRIA